LIKTSPYLAPDLESSLIPLLAEMHFAISFVSALHVLHVLMPSSAVTAQPEPEAGCLLQSRGQLALKAEEAVPAGRISFQSLCSGGFCKCARSIKSFLSLTLDECSTQCLAYPAFALDGNFQGRTRCSCCGNRDTTEATSSVAYQHENRPDLSLSGRLQGLCEDRQCSCPSARVASPSLSLSDCGYFCQVQGLTTLSYRPEAGILRSFCTCCSSDQLSFGGSTRVYNVLDPPATAVGDPHITTLDGQHYTLMQQGIFSLWHLSGLEIQFHSENSLVKTVPVDWQIYARYAGHQAFTKGLLLVDKSGGALRQVLEMTAEDCLWRARKADGEWTMVGKDEEIWVPDGHDFATGFQVTKNGAKGYKHVHFNVNTKSGKTDKVVLSTSCRPHHNMNLQLMMRERSDYRFVEGEVKVARGSRAFSTLQTDSEFAIDAKWQDLGGSDQAASYLDMDQAGDAFVAKCSREEEEKAHEACSKHLGNLGDIQGNLDETFYEDCVYDVCHGAGETAAELAAELLESTRAIQGI